ncbi:MFS transporter [Nocardiopsis sp. MG754419]|uniref:MFS transporter n=1 Tax=Nocardiopsis sp. MG754419 TaxID=2259865 RepID=UPI001BAD7C6F|nr:MFS transporter [Nocardiopsis sp. MG754419]MBR8744931.1 MFS transporter [Nocardiopsis sp. MG754419]
MSVQTRPGRPVRGLGRDFNRFWVGSMSSSVADGIMATVLPLMAAMFTNDPVLVAGLAFVRFLPWLIFGLFVGALVDRLDRGKVLIVANLVRAATLVALAVVVAAGNATILTLYAVMFVVMSCEAFYDIGGRALMPELVAKTSLDRANSRIVGGRVVVQDFGGAPIGGLLIVVAAALPLAVNAGAYLLGALILIGLPLSARRPRAEVQNARRPAVSILASVREGTTFLWNDRPLRYLALHGSLVAMGFMLQSSVLVLILRVHFGVPEALYGVFISSAAVGALLGALSVSRVVAFLGRFRTQVIAFTVMGVGCIGFIVSPNAYVAGFFWALIAVAMALSNTVTIGVAQLAIPAELRGRVLGSVQIFAMTFNAVGALIGGFLGRVDLRLPSLIGGVVVITATLLLLPALRTMARRADEAEDRDRREAENGE